MMPQITKDHLVKWPGRTTSPTEKKTDCAVDFIVGGRVYRNLKDLKVETINDRCLHKDIHGRYVLDMKERYPVFDSYDAAYEDRYFHWYLILDEGKLHIVYVDDGRNGADITEDADRVPWRAYKILEFWKYLDEDGKLMIGDDAGERSVT